jgi:hypothetical protein
MKGVEMQKDRIENFVGGWLIGNFHPSIQRSTDLEIGVKFFKAGDTELSHMQRIATEITIVGAGQVRIGSELLFPGDVLIIPPLEFADFEAFEDGVLTCIKFPSLPNDKVLE